MLHSVSENFETNTVKKLSKASLKNPKLKKEYKAVKDLLEQGIHPINLSEKSTYVSPNFLILFKIYKSDIFRTTTSIFSSS